MKLTSIFVFLKFGVAINKIMFNKKKLASVNYLKIVRTNFSTNILLKLKIKFYRLTESENPEALRTCINSGRVLIAPAIENVASNTFQTTNNGFNL